jgi:hypothetical protein
VPQGFRRMQRAVMSDTRLFQRMPRKRQDLRCACMQGTVARCNRLAHSTRTYHALLCTQSTGTFHFRDARYWVGIQ